MTRAYSLHRAAPVSALSALSLVLTYALALPVFGDRPTAWPVGGSLLVVAASVLLAVNHDRLEAPAGLEADSCMFGLMAAPAPEARLARADGLTYDPTSPAAT